MFRSVEHNTPTSEATSAHVLHSMLKINNANLIYYYETPLYFTTDGISFETYKPARMSIKNNRRIKERHPYNLYIHVKDKHIALRELQKGLNSQLKEDLKSNNPISVKKTLIKLVHEAINDPTHEGIDGAANTVEILFHEYLRNQNIINKLIYVISTDYNTAIHSVNVMALTLRFSFFCALDEGESKKLGLCALLHDVGKIKISPRILKAPRRLYKTGLARFLDALYVKRNRSYKGLSVFPILLVSNEFRRSDEELQVLGMVGCGNSISILETGKLDSVGLKNNGRMRAVALDGTVINGATQCRLLESSAMIGPGEKIELPTCGTKCERSEPLSDSVAFPRYTFPVATHRRMIRLESIERKNGDELYWNQCRIWSKLRDLFRDSGFGTPSMDVDDLYRHWSVPIEDYTWRHVLDPLQVGMITFIGKDMWFMDLFLNTRMMSWVFHLIVRGYAFDAVMRRMTNQKEVVYKRGTEFEAAQDAFNYMRTVSYRPVEYKGKALKDSYYFDTKKACGTALINNDKLVYLAAFSKDKAPREY